MKSYLIIFSRGKRYVEELFEFEASYPVSYIETSKRFRLPRMTTFTAVIKLNCFFNLRNKKGNKAWKRFVRRLI